MKLHRLAMVGMMLSIAGMALALLPREAPASGNKACATVQDIVDRNPDTNFFGPGWRVAGSAHLGTNPHLRFRQQASVVLQEQIEGVLYDYILAQMTDSGPVYFLFRDSCVVKAIKLEGRTKA